jgi:hypothetical protein
LSFLVLCVVPSDPRKPKPRLQSEPALPPQIL